MNKIMDNTLKRRLKKIIFYMLMDILTVSVSWIIGIALAGCGFRAGTLGIWYFFFGGMVFALLMNMIFGLYFKLFKYVDTGDVIKFFLAGVCEGVYFVVVASAVSTLSFEWSAITTLLYIPILVCGRFAYKIYLAFDNASKHSVDKKDGVRVMIVGAGDAGSMLIREMKTTDKIKMYPVCAIDDDTSKQGQMINGVKVVGGTHDIVYSARFYNIDEIIIAMPSVEKSKIREIIGVCKRTGCKVNTLPGVYEVAGGQVSVSSIKEVDVLDLLGREQIKVNIDEIIGYIENKTVLVTGGGGSIGSELCRQIASHKPKQLIIVDVYENNAYDIQQELLFKHPDLNLLVLIASVRDSKRVDCIFEKYRPEIVFHAAAHKHVPLMETSPNEAVKNNVSGTYKVADAAGRYGAKRFIQISTDKAVNPTNIMGATKRICEMIIQAMNKRYKNTEYVAVRFGNVLGSNGSVIPLFRKQIAEGGPITVTHKDIVRYFMTIPEAVSLVLQAGAYAKGGEIFVLDMGEPVKIYDLAINMIKLSGLEPFKDIDIKITGLRPGEKLYEERLMKEEGLKKTPNKLISIGKPLQFDEEALFTKIMDLYAEARNETDKMKELVHELVPTYKIDNRG